MTFERLKKQHNDVDYLVNFYAPWCTHCAALRPTWETLATDFAQVDSIQLLAMDATKNESDFNVTIAGVPTIYFFPSRTTTSEAYVGDRDLPSLANFLKDRATSASRLHPHQRDEF